MPVIILGGMFGGVYTPTEGAAVAVAYAVLIGTVVYQSLTLPMIFQSLRRVATMTAAVLIIVAASSSLSWVMSMEHAGDLVKGLFAPLQGSPVLTLLAISALILFLGTAMEENTMLVLFTPVLTPVVQAAGIDPVHFGLVFVLAVFMGLISPPVGISMFIACRIAGVTATEFTLAVWRPFLALVVSLVIISLFPQLVLFLPNLVMGR